MNGLVLRSQLEKLLLDWEAGRVAASAVHQWAVARYPGAETENELVNEVLGRLDALDVNLITAADVPALRRLLSSPIADVESAVDEYESYAARVDLTARQRALSADPLYARFCNRAVQEREDC